MNIQSIIQNILSNPILIILIIGGVSTLGRAIKSAQEQKAKKQASQQLREAQRDSHRTGKGASAQAQTSQTAATKNAAWDQKQQLRRDRIEQLRQQRVEQLKKIRQKRSTGQPVQSQTSATRPPAGPQRSPQTRSQPAAQSQSTPRQPARVPQRQSQPAARVVQQPAPRRRSRPAVIAPQPVKSTTSQSRRTTASRESIDRSAIDVGTTTAAQSKSAGKSVRAKFRQDMRSAIIAKEILGQPIGLRSPDASPMGTL